jgi:hypothetical protein
VYAQLLVLPGAAGCFPPLIPPPELLSSCVITDRFFDLSRRKA